MYKDQHHSPACLISESAKNSLMDFSASHKEDRSSTPAEYKWLEKHYQALKKIPKSEITKEQQEELYQNACKLFSETPPKTFLATAAKANQARFVLGKCLTFYYELVSLRETPTLEPALVQNN